MSRKIVQSWSEQRHTLGRVFRPARYSSRPQRDLPPTWRWIREFVGYAIGIKIGCRYRAPATRRLSGSTGRLEFVVRGSNVTVRTVAVLHRPIMPGFFVVFLVFLPVFLRSQQLVIIGWQIFDLLFGHSHLQL